MPIAKHVRHFYTAAAGWPDKRAAALACAGGTLNDRGRYAGGAYCQQCAKLDRSEVWVVHTDTEGQYWSDDTSHEEIGRMVDEGGPHCDVPLPELRWTACISGKVVYRELPEFARRIVVVLAVAHRNHTPGDDRPENLAAWCQYCHLHWDLIQHADTRKDRKDFKRPMLVYLVAAEGVAV
jgi:hypothetical protein